MLTSGSWWVEPAPLKFTLPPISAVPSMSGSALQRAIGASSKTVGDRMISAKAVESWSSSHPVFLRQWPSACCA